MFDWHHPELWYVGFVTYECFLYFLAQRQFSVDCRRARTHPALRYPTAWLRHAAGLLSRDPSMPPVPAAAVGCSPFPPWPAGQINVSVQRRQQSYFSTTPVFTRNSLQNYTDVHALVTFIQSIIQCIEGIHFNKMCDPGPLYVGGPSYWNGESRSFNTQNQPDCVWLWKHMYCCVNSNISDTLTHDNNEWLSHVSGILIPVVFTAIGAHCRTIQKCRPRPCAWSTWMQNLVIFMSMVTILQKII